MLSLFAQILFFSVLIQNRREMHKKCSNPIPSIFFIALSIKIKTEKFISSIFTVPNMSWNFFVDIFMFLNRFYGPGAVFESQKFWIWQHSLTVHFNSFLPLLLFFVLGWLLPIAGNIASFSSRPHWALTRPSSSSPS